MSKRLEQLIQSCQHGSLRLTYPNGKELYHQGERDGPAVQVQLHDSAALRSLLLQGDVGAARSYQLGQWDSPDLGLLLQWALANEDAVGPLIHGNFLGRLLARLSYLFQPNSLSGSKRNIQAHYDIGNDFYQLFLDSSMSYSSALYTGSEASELDLYQAQQRKYQRALEQLDASSGKLLEIGCGWGGFAETASTQGDYQVKGITLSEAQRAYAQQRLQANDNVAISLEDYRQQSGNYQNIVSIEMLEAIGERQWPQYFRQLGTLLQKRGRALVQTITIEDSIFPRYRASGDAMRSYVFPGGLLPHPSGIKQCVQAAGLKISDYYNFGCDYVKTLNCWLVNLERNGAAIKDAGYPDSLLRLWRFYLSYCVAGFASGRTDVAQITIEHAR